jgi:hypothetical protein
MDKLPQSELYRITGQLPIADAEKLMEHIQHLKDYVKASSDELYYHRTYTFEAKSYRAHDAITIKRLQKELDAKQKSETAQDYCNMFMEKCKEHEQKITNTGKQVNDLQKKFDSIQKSGMSQAHYNLFIKECKNYKSRCEYAEFMLNVSTDLIASLEAKLEAKPQAELEAKLEAKPQAKRRVWAKPQAKPQAKLEAKLEAKLGAKLKAEPQAKRRVWAKLKAEPQAKRRVWAKLKAEPQAKIEWGDMTDSD